jgi:hypothetical protein
MGGSLSQDKYGCTGSYHPKTIEKYGKVEYLLKGLGKKQNYDANSGKYG